MLERTTTRMTAAEFLMLPETMQPTELLEGELIVTPSPILEHQDVVLDTGSYLKELSKVIGGKTYIAPLDVYLDDENIPQPDVVWLAPNSQCVKAEKHLVGAPELIVEVLSPGSVKRDKVTKYRLYDKHGVYEYWLIDPSEEYIEVFVRSEGQLRFFGVFEPDDTFQSALLGGTTIEVQRLFGK